MTRRLTGAMRVRMAVLLALALALRLLAPEGWMPAAGGGLMLCPGASAPMAMAGHHRDGREQPAHVADHPCAFAQAGTAAPPPVPLASPSIAVTPELVLALRLTVATGRGLAAPPPPATGPPTFA